MSEYKDWKDALNQLRKINENLSYGKYTSKKERRKAFLDIDKILTYIAEELHMKEEAGQ